MIYDLIIIGGGPAGSSAAVYAARKKLNTIFITLEWGGQSTVSESIYNWIGHKSIRGKELADSFKEHVEANTGDTLRVKEGTKAEKVTKNEDGTFKVETSSGEVFESKTILIATGSHRRKIPAKNADILEHKGLTYCASCDGPVFAGMDVAVVGAGNAGFETAAQLLAYCKSVTLVHRREEFRADKITVDKVLAHPNMKVLKNAEIQEITGEKFVDGLIYKDKITGESKKLEVKGIFIEIGQIPNTDLVKDVVERDKGNRIIIDPWTQKTKTPGVWAAGDCTNVLYHQNNIAAGDAVRALEDIYLAIHAK